MAAIAAGGEATLAERRVGRCVAGGDAIHREVTEARDEFTVVLPILDVTGGRADAVHVGRAPGGGGRQRAETLGQDAEATAHENPGRPRTPSPDRRALLAGYHHREPPTPPH